MLRETKYHALFIAFLLSALIGIGGFAEARAALAVSGMNVSFGKVLHPSPASPAANRGWAEAATRQLTALGIW